MGRNMVGGQVSYRPLRCNSSGVQMYRIPIHNKIRCTVKAWLSLGKNESCAFIFAHNTFQKEDVYTLCYTIQAMYEYGGIVDDDEPQNLF